MLLAQAIRVGAWILVGLNLLMGLGAIGIFMRMAPAIEKIIVRNERSLQACEDMLASLALATGKHNAAKELRQSFSAALTRAKTNITEAQEPVVIELIGTTFDRAFSGDISARERTVAAVVALADINRKAMIYADQQAQQLGRAGAWGVVFMASSAFLAGMIFIRSLNRRVVNPFEELHAVIAAQQSGETMRRCTGVELPQDMRMIFNGINEILDRGQAPSSSFRNPFVDPTKLGYPPRGGSLQCNNNKEKD